MYCTTSGYFFGFCNRLAYCLAESFAKQASIAHCVAVFLPSSHTSKLANLPCASVNFLGNPILAFYYNFDYKANRVI